MRTGAARSAAPNPRASRRRLHLPGLERRREDHLGFGHRLDPEQLLAQPGGPGDTPGVPAKMLAEFERRLARVPLGPHRQTRVLERGGEALCGGGIGTLSPPLEQIAALREDPRIAERA